MKDTVGFKQKFLTDRDDTGREIHVSMRTGRKYYVEYIGSDRPANWGSVNPVNGEFMVKKGWGKERGSIDESDSMITKENGFDEVYTGTGSVASKIAEIDAQYPDKA